MAEFKIISSKNRIYGLDILRAFAILFVVYSHGYDILKSVIPEKYYSLFSFDGVAIFFVLSGFLIGQILITICLQENISRKDLVNFWFRRWFRTLPNYFLILSILGAVFILSNRMSVYHIIKYYFFSQNLFYNHPDFFPEAWSLSVEEWFYLTVPVLMIILIRFFSVKNVTSVLIIAFSIIVMVTLYRFMHTFKFPCHALPDWDNTYRKQVITRLDSLMYGVLGAYAYLFYRDFWNRNKNLFFVAGLIILSVSKYILGFTGNVFYNNVFSFSVVSTGVLFLLPFFHSIKTGKGFIYKAFTFISIISYSMYLINFSLVHELILEEINKCIGVAGSQNSLFLFFNYFLFWLLTILLSYLIFIFWERPTTKLRDKLSLKEKH